VQPKRPKCIRELQKHDRRIVMDGLNLSKYAAQRASPSQPSVAFYCLACVWRYATAIIQSKMVAMTI
jgi:hypothetical protein